MSPSTLYYHFRDKDDLLSQTLEQELELLAECLRPAEEARPLDDPLHRLERMLKTLIGFQLEWQMLA